MMSELLIESLNDDKVGNFEWIVSYDQLQPFIHSIYHDIIPPTNINDITIDKEEQHQYERMLRVLEVGCGTSSISLHLSNEPFVSNVISIDNDENCIKHLRQQQNQLLLSSSLEYLVYDIVEYNGNDSNIMLNENESFDIIIDKGTLDAILVEGSISNMLIEINRLLKPGGTYLVCSLHSREILSSLLSMKALDYNVNIYTTNGNINMNDSNNNTVSSSFMTGTIGLCKKSTTTTTTTAINITLLQQEELEIMNYYYQQRSPLLTTNKENEIRNLYQTSYLNNNSSNDDDANSSRWEQDYSISLDDAYMIMFNSEERVDYTFTLFTEDLNNFPRTKTEVLTYHEAINFLKIMQ